MHAPVVAKPCRTHRLDAVDRGLCRRDGLRGRGRGAIPRERRARAEAQGAHRSITKFVSDWIRAENLDVRDIVGEIYERTNEQYGTNETLNQ